MKKFKYTVIIPGNEPISLLLSIVHLAHHSQFLKEILVITNHGLLSAAQIDGMPTRVKIISIPKLDVYARANLGAELAKTDWILFYQDDVYAPVDWDADLEKVINNLPKEKQEKLMVNFQIVEPGYQGVNPERCIEKSFGISWVTFKMHKFEKYAEKYAKTHPLINDTLGGLNPVMFNRKYFLKLGGYAKEPWPSDADMKLFQKVEKEGYHIKYNRLFYHFQCGGINKREDNLHLILKWIGRKDA